MLPIFALLTSLAVAACVAAVPTSSAAIWTDPPFSVSTSTMASAITCPRGVQGKTGGVVFLVHGTGEFDHGLWIINYANVFKASDGNGTWANGPYNLILPDMGPGESQLKFTYS